MTNKYITLKKYKKCIKRKKNCVFFLIDSNLYIMKLWKWIKNYFTFLFFNIKYLNNLSLKN